jgi:hypothetical protein
VVAVVLVAVALVANLLVACADDALIVEVHSATAADRVCLTAHGDGAIAFSRAYGEDGAPVHGTLTFLAGDQITDAVRITARSWRGPTQLGWATGLGVLGHPDSSRLNLGLARCHRRSSRATALVARDLAAGVGPATGIAAADVDGDGQDDLWLETPTGGQLFANGALSGVPWSVAEERLLARGDVDANCAMDLVLASPDGARAVDAASGAVVVSLGTNTEEAGLGRFSPGASQAAVARNGALVLDDLRTGTPRCIDGCDDPGARTYTYVAAGDLTGDGLSDLLTSGALGARVWRGSEDPSRLDGALPAAFDAVTGPVALGDVDGDGTLDAAGATDTGVLIAFNRGDGLLELRGPGVDLAAVSSLWLADVNGDCLDDVVAIAEGTLVVAGSDGNGTFASIPVESEAVLAAAIADVDGDGRLEIATLSTDGTVVGVRAP